MQSATWLRIAAGLTAFQAAGHTFGAVLAGPSNAEESALRETMGAFRVSLMGMERSYWDFYYGSGWAITALAVTVAAVMWLLAPISRQSPSAARPMILALAAGYAAVTAISALYFVTAPIVIAAVITVCLIMAAIAVRSPSAAAALLCVAALSPASVWAQAGAPPAPPRIDLTELRAYVTRFTGANPGDCGQHVKDLRRSLACAYDAVKANKSFWTFKHEEGIDSQVFRGLLGTTEGTMYQFSYDTAPCGGPSCAGRFSLNRCGTPTVLSARSGRSDFGCDEANPRRLPKPQSPIPNP